MDSVCIGLTSSNRVTFVENATGFVFGVPTDNALHRQNSLWPDFAKSTLADEACGSDREVHPRCAPVPRLNCRKSLAIVTGKDDVIRRQSPTFDK